MRIVDCTQDDADAVCALERDCIDCPWPRADVVKALSDPAVLFLKAESGGRFVGYAGARVIIDEAEIYNIAVAPAYRRQGAGEALMRELLRRAKACGARKAFLEVKTDNEPAKALYEKLGFTVAYERKKYYGSNDAYVMTISL